MPLHYEKLSNSDWKPAEEKGEKKAATWQGSLLPMGERLILTETCFSSSLITCFPSLHCLKVWVNVLIFFPSSFGLERKGGSVEVPPGQLE